MFKTAKVHWQARQFWSEVIAYQLGCLAGVSVPPAFVAVDENTGEVGALLEFFFGYPDRPVSGRLLHGSDLLGRTIIDEKEGRPHSIRTNIRFCKLLYRMEDAENWWGKLLSFDALIGNTDRHPDNWGLLKIQEGTEVPTCLFAPLFDNATSLGYEKPDEKIASKWPTVQMDAYIRRGTHHAGWELHEDGAPHLDLCGRFVSSHPQCREAMDTVVGFPMSEAERVFERVMALGLPEPFSEKRGECPIFRVSEEPWILTLRGIHDDDREEADPS